MREPPHNPEAKQGSPSYHSFFSRTRSNVSPMVISGGRIARDETDRAELQERWLECVVVIYRKYRGSALKRAIKIKSSPANKNITNTIHVQSSARFIPLSM